MSDAGGEGFDCAKFKVKEEVPSADTGSCVDVDSTKQVIHEGTDNVFFPLTSKLAAIKVTDSMSDPTNPALQYVTKSESVVITRSDTDLLETGNPFPVLGAPLPAIDVSTPSIKLEGDSISVLGHPLPEDQIETTVMNGDASGIVSIKPEPETATITEPTDQNNALLQPLSGQQHHCPKPTQTRKSRVIIEITRKIKRSYRCRICSADVGSVEGLMIHLKRAHNIKSTGPPRIVNASERNAEEDDAKNAKLLESICKEKTQTSVSSSGESGDESLPLPCNKNAGSHLRCKYCFQDFGVSYRCRYLKHLKFHKENRFFTCTFCGMCFLFEVHLQMHLRELNDVTSNATDPEKCSKCDDSFANRKCLLFHMTRHDGRHRCQICEKSFPLTSDVNKHTKMQHMQRQSQYKCSECDHVVKNRDKLLQHMKVFHYNVICPFCQAAFTTMHICDAHIKRMHTESEGKRPFACSMCSQAFNAPAYLTRHYRQCHHTQPPGFQPETDKPIKVTVEPTEVLPVQTKTETSTRRGRAIKKKQNYNEESDSDVEYFESMKYVRKSDQIKYMEMKEVKENSETDSQEEVLSDDNVESRRVSSNLEEMDKNSLVCSTCLKTFSNPWNRIRHEKCVHPRRRAKISTTRRSSTTSCGSSPRGRGIRAGAQTRTSVTDNSISSQESVHDISVNAEVPGDLKFENAPDLVVKDEEKDSQQAASVDIETDCKPEVKQLQEICGTSGEIPLDIKQEDKTDERIAETPERAPENKVGLPQCPYCNKYISSISGLRYHIDKKHPEQGKVDIPTFDFKCPYCTDRVRTFTSKQSLLRHAKNIHSKTSEDMEFVKPTNRGNGKGRRRVSKASNNGNSSTGTSTYSGTEEDEKNSGVDQPGPSNRRNGTPVPATDPKHEAAMHISPIMISGSENTQKDNSSPLKKEKKIQGCIEQLKDFSTTAVVTSGPVILSTELPVVPRNSIIENNASLSTPELDLILPSLKFGIRCNHQSPIDSSPAPINPDSKTSDLELTGIKLETENPMVMVTTSSVKIQRNRNDVKDAGDGDSGSLKTEDEPLEKKMKPSSPKVKLGQLSLDVSPSIQQNHVCEVCREIFPNKQAKIVHIFRNHSTRNQ